MIVRLTTNPTWNPGVVSLTREQRARKSEQRETFTETSRNRGEPAVPVYAKKFIRDPAVISGFRGRASAGVRGSGARQRHRWTIRCSSRKNRTDGSGKTWSDSPKADDDHFERATRCYGSNDSRTVSGSRSDRAFRETRPLLGGGTRREKPECRPRNGLKTGWKAVSVVRVPVKVEFSWGMFTEVGEWRWRKCRSYFASAILRCLSADLYVYYRKVARVHSF